MCSTDSKVPWQHEPAMRPPRLRAAALLVAFDFLVDQRVARLLAEAHPGRTSGPIESYIASVADRCGLPIGSVLVTGGELRCAQVIDGVPADRRGPPWRRSTSPHQPRRSGERSVAGERGPHRHIHSVLDRVRVSGGRSLPIIGNRTRHCPAGAVAPCPWPSPWRARRRACPDSGSSASTGPPRPALGRRRPNR